MKKESPSSPYLNQEDIAALFGCGRSKALLIMHEVGTIRVGRTSLVRQGDLERYLDEHGGQIRVRWPRKGAGAR